jgi:UDP-GlcNAc:undecaprenyl-phosphate/decaprenyl-phosphate GlcNAc-1-phosphate transferase
VRVYLLVLAIAAAVTFVATPVARKVGLATGAMTAVRDRDVHTTPTPRLGGTAMWAGFALAMVFASQMPFLAGVFARPREALGILAGATLVCLLGAADDIWDLDWMTKLAGQVLAAGVMAWSGVQLITFPVFGVTIGSSRLSLVATIVVVVVCINAVNFVDGLDGLAAGLVAIGGSAFFVYTYLLTRDATPGDYSNLATLVTAALVGICVGFLPHNFFPSRIFMGDSGAMLLGLLIAAAGIVVTGQVGLGEQTRREAFPAFLPILLPVAVILLPLTDMALAVVRRVRAGTSPFQADRLHMHHRLLGLGHSHRRSVLIMYLWTAVFAFGAAALALFSTTTVLVAVAIGCVVTTVITVVGRSRAEPDRPGVGPPSDSDDAAGGDVQVLQAGPPDGDLPAAAHTPERKDASA